MKTKMFATVLAMLMLLTAVVISPASAADGVVVKGSETVVPYGTTEAEVTVSVVGVPESGLATARFNTRVEGATITSGEASSDLPLTEDVPGIVGPVSDSATKGVYFMWTSVKESIKGDATFVTFKVAIPADAACGTVYNVIVTLSDDPDDFVSGDNATALAVTAENGKIVVGHDDANATHVEAVAATPEKDGNIEYWICTRCNKLFSDAKCTTEITLEQTVVKYVAPAYIPGDVNNDGNISAKDIILTMKYMLNPDKVTGTFVFEAADMDQNGKITAKDVIAIMKEMLKKK